MKEWMQSSMKTLLLLSVFVLGSACSRNSSDFYKKAGMSAVSDIESPEFVKDVLVNDEKKGNTEEDCKNGAEACDLKPVVTKAGVVTILLALGDLYNDKVVVTEGSARLLAQNSVKYASPIEQPKILVVKDFNHRGESANDTEYIAKVLLSNYKKVDVLNETTEGLKASDFDGYDLIWFNNPGHPMGSEKSMKALVAFNGGVILSGDDLTQGNGFSLTPLTGLKFKDNGGSISCDGQTYSYDNNSITGHRYQVEISSQFLPGLADDIRFFEYGNDIDNSTISGELSKIEILAYASGAKGACETNKRPVIVRYEK